MDKKEKTKGKKTGEYTTGMAFGCLVDIALIVCYFFALQEDTMVSTLTYALILAVPALIIRWLLHREGMLGGWMGRLIGPAFMVAAMLLAIYVPIQTDKPNGETGPVTPRDIAQKVTDKKNVKGGSKASSKQGTQEPPPGVKYVPADPDNVPTVEEAIAELNSLIGLKDVKAEVEKFTKLVQVTRQRQAAGLKVAPISYHMVFTGNPGTGKTTVARIMAKIYRALGIVKSGHLVETDRGGLVGEYVGQTAVKTGKVIDFALDGVLFIDEAYAITEGDGKQGYGAECIATLLKRMEDDRDRLVVIVAGYTDEMKHFIDANPGLQSRFNRYIHFPDYSAEELAAIFRMNAKKNQYVLSPEVEAWLDPAMQLWTKDRDRKFGNGRYVRNLFEKAVERQAMRVAEIQNPTKEQLMTLTMEDLGNLGSSVKQGGQQWTMQPPPGVKYVPADPDKVPTVEEAIAELNSLIGLKEVKAEVEKFTRLVQVAKQRQAAGYKVAPISYHMVFTGNPGTGKTTVARIMAKIYRALGIVKNGHLVETDRGGLVGEYVGQTAVKTGKVIDFARDGVLFIDEAYAITEGDGKQGYGSECIATLLKRMEDDRDRLVVIVAGYTDEMKRFIDANPGLQSRFNRYIHFPDYTAAELADIFRMNAKKNQYILSPDVERWLEPAIHLWTKNRDRKFGNGRYVRNLFEKAVERQAARVSQIPNPTNEQLITITMKDVGIKLKNPDASAED